MTKDIFKFLKEYSTNTLRINRLITSAFLITNNLFDSKNKNISKYKITSGGKEHAQLLIFIKLLQSEEANQRLSIESLIELFEFVISPDDKIVNGAVFTPAYIREYIVNETLNSSANIKSGKFGDLSCGCGGFLLTLADTIMERTDATYHDIYKDNLFGVDIAGYSIERTEIILTLNALSKGEVCRQFTFNLCTSNSLKGNSHELFKQVRLAKGFDAIVGNPPYVCSRNIDRQSLRLLTKWSVTKTGHPDLYIPFFQLGIESLKQGGTLGYITVNTFFKSINGRALREYFANEKLPLSVINFGGEQVFKSRNTYTCICFVKKQTGKGVKYIAKESKSINSVIDSDYRIYSYADMDNHDGWNLAGSDQADDLVLRIESTGEPFKNKFVTRNGIATLKNEIYKFTPTKESKQYYYLTSEDEIYKIEKAICRDIVNSNKIKTSADLKLNREKIIFPYFQKKGEIVIIEEPLFKSKYPGAYSYLKSKKSVLSTRDKGDGFYEKWYAYGRRQSLDINSHKLFFPHICHKPTFILCEEKDLLFYNGIAVISDDLNELKLLKIVLESDLFFSYVMHTTKNYASGYISLSKNYIKNFGLYKFTDYEKEQLLKMTNLNDVNEFLFKLYDIKPGLIRNGRSAIGSDTLSKRHNENRKKKLSVV